MKLSALRTHPNAATAVALLLALLSFMLFRSGFHGGLSDDAQYLTAGRAWFEQGPHLGHTHWSLRHPIVLAVAAMFWSTGLKIAAAMWVPTLYGLLFAGAGFAALFRLASPRSAWLWLALVLLNPVIHEMATSLFPEIAELALITAGLGLVWWACVQRRLAGPALFLAGLLLGLAFLTRETAALVGPLVAVLLWKSGKGWRGFALVAFGGLIPLVADTLFLHALSGDWLYRLHVDSAHTQIASAHLRGGTFEGRVFLNPALGARWIPAGPTRIHWIVNPIADFVIDWNFALLVPGALLAAFLFLRHDQASCPLRAAALALALLSYAGVCWLLMLRPQPRYFLLVMLAASVVTAVALDRGLGGSRRTWARALLAVLLIAGLTGVFRHRDNERLPRLVLPYRRSHPGV